MTTDTEVIPTGHAPAGLKWKKKKHFDGTTCGLAKCKHDAEGYIVDTKPTKGNTNGQLWWGPACTPCIRKEHKTLVPTTLPQLAFQYKTASALAGALDIEVGDMKKRLEAAGVDETGTALATAPPPPTPPLEQPPGAAVPALAEGANLAVDAVVIPTQTLAAALTEAKGVLNFLGTFNVTDQASMDNAGTWLKEVKSKWSNIEENRLLLGKPLREQLTQIQGYFKPALDVLLTAEGILKQKISEGAARAQAAQQQALADASVAHQQQNTAALAVAQQTVVATDMDLPAGVNSRPVIKFAVEKEAELPGNFWMPNLKLIQQWIDAGHRDIPGVRIWEEQQVSAPRSGA